MRWKDRLFYDITSVILQQLKVVRGPEVRHFTVLVLAGAVFGLLAPTSVQAFTYGRLVG